VDRIDFVGADVDKLLKPTADWGDQIPYRAREAGFLNLNASVYGYVRVGDSWIRR
jgi:hypothetical protein